MKAINPFWLSPKNISFPRAISNYSWFELTVSVER